MGDGMDKPTVEQTENRRRKGWVHAQTVGAVAHDQGRIAAEAPQVFAIDNRYRNRLAVRRDRIKTIDRILIAIKPAACGVLLTEA